MVCSMWKIIAYAPHLWRNFDEWKSFNKSRDIIEIFKQPRFAQLERLGLKCWKGKTLLAKFMKVVNHPLICTQIKTLDLSGCHNEGVLRQLSFLPNLHTLIIGHLGSTTFRDIITVKSLRSLDCSHTEVFVNYSFPKLNRLTQLTSLNLDGCITSDTCMHLGYLTNLTSLSMRNSFNLKLGVNSLLFCTKLERLDLYGCCRLRDNSMILISQLPLLRELNLEGVTNLTDTGLFYVASLKSLEILHVSACCKLSDAGLKQIPARVHVNITGTIRGLNMLFRC